MTHHALSEAPESQLIEILNCNQYKQFAALPIENKEALLKPYSNLKKLFKKSALTIISQSIYNALTDSTSYPLYFFWSLLIFAHLGLLSLTILTCIFGLAALSLGILCFCYQYRKQIKDTNKYENNYIFLKLKNDIYCFLIEKHQNELSIKTNPETASPFEFNPLLSSKNKLFRYKETFGTAGLAAIYLLGTYYFSIDAILTAFGITVLTTTSLALPLAALACALIGLYFGYQFYKSNKEESIIHKNLKALNQNNFVKSSYMEQHYCLNLQNNHNNNGNLETQTENFVHPRPTVYPAPPNGQNTLFFKAGLPNSGKNRYSDNTLEKPVSFTN